MTSFMNRMVSPGTWDLGVVLVILLIVAVIVVLGVLISRLPARAPRRRRDDQRTRDARAVDAALESREHRYATGQIEDAEFERRRETILAGRARSA